MPAPNVRCVIRYKDKAGKARVLQRSFTLGDSGQVAIDWPKDCPWPPEVWRQVVVEFSPPVTGKGA